MIDAIPPQRAKVLAFIREEVGAGRVFPSAAQIAAHMGWRNASSAQQCCSALAGHRALRRKYDGKRVVYELVEVA